MLKLKRILDNSPIGLKGYAKLLDMAAFWLDDSDAVSDKLAAYFTYVVKH